MRPPRLSIVIPCYNEAGNLPLLIERCAGWPDAEVVLVDNGSTDDTMEVLRRLLPAAPACRIVRVETNRGYGAGILAGLAEARGDVLGWTHADLQTDPRDALRGIELFHAHGPDIFVKGRRRGRPLADVLFTAGMSAFETLLLARPMRDINGQPTMFARGFFETWRAPPLDFSLDLYAYYHARAAGLPVHRFPVTFGRRAHGVSSWNVNPTARWKFIRRTVVFSVRMRSMRTTRESR